jgi:phosphoribosyl 1,2-cyclic phosphodiesterase
LSSLEVNDAVLGALTRLPKLRRVYLQNVLVTDETADRLAGLSNLRVIDLSGAQISKEGLSRLSKALPNCRIIREEMPSTTARAAMRQCLVAEAIRRLLSPH